MTFENIKNIDISNSTSWQNKMFITFDIDWCTNEVLSYTLDIVEKYDIKATFFVTHETKLLERMRVNPNIELGIHPNFNFLLNGDFRQGSSSKEVVQYYKKFVPNAVSVRSHSLTQSSNIFPIFEDEGFIYECNTFIPLQGGIQLPYKHTKQLIKVPHIFEDDVRELYEDEWNLKKYLNYKGIKVFDFHPIHIFLNSENIERYNSAREHFQNFEELKKCVNTKSYGTKDFLIDLIKEGLDK
ncbi:polysaccharide deacetylase family protein [Aliarcobacter cryaerophilus]|uniref:polysaccharide deacetylase WbmS family protein n=1 Tax=Aliarcobacter cryaerophilus TaxID=28198 RepID=UPI003BB0C0DE